jgi:hypothetical protein
MRMALLARARRALLPALLSVAAASSAGCNASECTGERCGDAGNASTKSDASPAVVEREVACATQTERATRGEPKPVDVVFVIDNSGSMSDEIAAVRNSINVDFAQIIAESGLDYRVVLLSRHGTTDTAICVDPPLGGVACDASAGTAAGIAATQTEVFHQYSQDIGSQDPFCQILETFDRPDAHGVAPQGWQAWLRPEAQKAIVMITDDSARCSYVGGDTLYEFGREPVDAFADALQFHHALLARSGAQFGVPPDVKYQFFSIVGMSAHERPDEPYFPNQGLNTGTCGTAPGAGLSYQALSIVTDALRYPVCEGRSFDAVFRVLARSVIQASKADCVFELPDPPELAVLDESSVNLEYREASDRDPRRFTQVRSATACKDDHSFFIRDRIELCPAACRAVQSASAPEINILYGCTAIPQ